MELPATITLLTCCQLLLLLLLPTPAQLQHYYPHRRLYYDAAPRLRRLEYVAAPYVGGYVAPPAAHYQQQTPNFQLINYRASYQPLTLEYQQQQPPAPPAAPPAPAAALPALYPQSSVQYVQRSAAPQTELAKYRYEGNYMPIQQRVPVAAPPPPISRQQQQQQHQQLQQQQQQLQHQQQQQQQQLQHQQLGQRTRRYASKQAADAVAAESRTRPTKESKYFHDILMRFDGPHGRSHGHVVEHPKQRERRFETQRGTNRYKGEVIWTDRRGGHGEHRWDLAQGKL
ncbi:PAX-interacting protein 1 [Drosophila novamexicana]|uniref:PAX-interacting protein 1 n=1 Tax=Drosophila novamexicana TaxID=47314 RepID=UPI0011E5F258|nr:PAX-interacting protein 1 [Drosophila novamexicana]